jgi:hypothetical protein
VIQPLSHFSEGYGPYGNTAAQGILNQLGRPGLDLFSILIRETVQNSWDARISDSTTVHFSITGRTLTATQLDFLCHTVLAEEPEQLNLHKVLSSIASDGLQVLTISDRGTTGLNGPMRADAPNDETGSRNFVNFLYNVGQSKDQQLSGGTYGYGKSILYRASQLHTICVYTRCFANGCLQSRFMVAALQPPAEKTSSNSTGRHWWGYKNNQDKILEPVIGMAADELALGLGMPQFKEDDTGTSCMVLLPVLGDCSLYSVMQSISQSLLWYFWPKMLSNSDGKVPMHFSVYHEENLVPIPDPCDYSPLNGFVETMSLLKTSSADTQDSLSRVVSITSQRPKRRLGRLALTRFPMQERRNQDSGESEFVLPVPNVSHHVALMRNAELVVKYLEGDRLPISHLEYAGVFITDTEVDASFAKAEPPTHDDWNIKSMTEKQDKVLVNVALREIQKELKDFVTPQTMTGRDEALLPLGTFADLLGRMFSGVEGSAGYIQPSEEPVWRKQNKRPSTEGGGNGANTTNSEPFDFPEDDVTDDNRDGQNGSRQSASSLTTGSDSHDSDGGKSSDEDSFSSQEAVTAKSGDQTSSRDSQGTPSTGIRRKAKIELLDEGQLTLLRDMPVVLTRFQVKHAANSRATRVEVEAGVLLDNGDQESEPPANKTDPEVLLWIDSAGKERSGSEAVLIPGTDDNTWQVAVICPDDALLQINFVVKEVF